MKEGFDSPTGYESRDGAVVARRAHNPKVAGSSPAPATKRKKSSSVATFFVLNLPLNVFV